MYRFLFLKCVRFGIRFRKGETLEFENSKISEVVLELLKFAKLKSKTWKKGDSVLLEMLNIEK